MAFRADRFGRVEPALLAGRRVLFVMAAAAEYGPHLKKRFTPLMTGVGPVEAGTVLAAALASMKADGTLPDLVVSLGSAGSRILEQTEVYQAASVSYRDMDASPLGFPRGETPFLDLPRVISLSLDVPGLRSATLSTGANVVSGSPMRRSTPIWSTWRLSPCCAPACCLACR